jgi:hypothetical protein
MTKADNLKPSAQVQALQGYKKVAFFELGGKLAHGMCPPILSPSNSKRRFADVMGISCEIPFHPASSRRKIK